MVELLSTAFVTLIVIIDPFAVVPMYVALTRSQSADEKKATALKATAIGTIILISFAFAGDKLLDAMNISEPAFRIAGGFLLLLAAMEMVMARTSGGMQSTTGAETKEAIHRDDVSVFPLAIPLIAGPGAMTSVVVLMRKAEAMGPVAMAGIIGVLLLTLLLTYISLRAGDRMMETLGVTGTNVLTRVFGIILAALAVQFMINGAVEVVKTSF